MNDFEKRSLQEFKDMHDRIKNLVFHNHLDDGYGDYFKQSYYRIGDTK